MAHRKGATYWLKGNKYKFLNYLDKSKKKANVEDDKGDTLTVSTVWLVKDRFSPYDLREGRVFTNGSGTRARLCLGTELFFTYYKTKPGASRTTGTFTGDFLGWAKEVYESWEEYQKALGSDITDSSEDSEDTTEE